MMTIARCLALAFLAAYASTAHAQATDTALIERNKKVVLEFYRLVFEAKNLKAAPDFIVEDYIQHNPRVAGGLKGFNEFFSKIWTEPVPVAATLRSPPDIIMAEGDLVTLVFKRMRPEPSDPAKQYPTYWFDTYRINKDGKIVEHWDAATK